MGRLAGKLIGLGRTGQPDLASWYGPASALSWWLAALAVPLAAGFVAARFSARDKRPEIRTLHGCVAGVCAAATAALLLAVLTSVTIALFPHRVPDHNANAGCEEADNPPRLDMTGVHQRAYWSVGPHSYRSTRQRPA